MHVTLNSQLDWQVGFANGALGALRKERDAILGRLKGCSVLFTNPSPKGGAAKE